MGIFGSKSKSASPVEPPADLRKDLADLIREVPSKEGHYILGRREALQYLQQRLPSDESPEEIAVCDGATGWINGILLLTNRRVITVLYNNQSGKMTAVALPFTDITNLSYSPSKTVFGYAAKFNYRDGDLLILVGIDSNHGRKVLDSINEKLNTSGRYGI